MLSKLFFCDADKKIVTYELHHLHWEIQELYIEKDAINYPLFRHLSSNTPDVLHFSPGVKVLAWGKEI
jgi:uncharacterized protein